MQRIEVRSQVDVERVRRAARQAAVQAGLNPTAAAEWSLVATELATNLVKHAFGGALSFSREDTPRKALVLLSTDSGPGIPDVPAAMKDGFSSGTGLGGGLGILRRYSDDMQVETSPAGTLITVRKWLDR